MLAHRDADDRKDENSEGYLTFSRSVWNPGAFRKIPTNKTTRII
jgi:hypothetical protein